MNNALETEIRAARQRVAQLLDQRVIPPTQLATAQALASAYGHTWGTALAMSPAYGVEGEDGVVSANPFPCRKAA